MLIDSPNNSRYRSPMSMELPCVGRARCPQRAAGRTEGIPPLPTVERTKTSQTSLAFWSAVPIRIGAAFPLAPELHRRPKENLRQRQRPSTVNIQQAGERTKISLNLHSIERKKKSPNHLSIFVIIPLIFLSACSTTTTPNQIALAPTTCAELTNTFRAFRQQSFPTNWTCEAGIVKSIKGGGPDLITREKFKDFELILDWKVTKGANSGILYGVSEATSDTYWSGPEMQINDDPNHKDGQTPRFSAGSLYDLIAPNDTKKLFRTGEWNHVRLVSKNGHVEHWLNAAKILEYDWDSPGTRALIAKSKFATQPHFMKDRHGHIALQHHGDEVHFRSIRIKRL